MTVARLPGYGMLRVFKTSGDEVLSVQFAGLAEILGLDTEPVTVIALKRHLRHLCGQTRFKQRLLADGDVLFDGFILKRPTDVQLVLLPFKAVSEDYIRQLLQAARENDIISMEQILQSPQDPDLDIGGAAALHVTCGNGCVAATRLLLEADADKEKAAHNGSAPMHVASAEGHVEVVRLLLEAKADKDAPGARGLTAYKWPLWQATWR